MYLRNAAVAIRMPSTALPWALADVVTLASTTGSTNVSPAASAKPNCAGNGVYVSLVPEGWKTLRGKAAVAEGRAGVTSSAAKWIGSDGSTQFCKRERTGCIVSTALALDSLRATQRPSLISMGEVLLVSA